jgi:hypothetical protein
MEQQQKHRPLGITIIAILTIIDGIAFLASGIAAVTVAPFLFGVDINTNNVPPATGTSTLGSVTIPDTLLVGMSSFCFFVAFLVAADFMSHIIAPASSSLVPQLSAVSCLTYVDLLH